MELTQHVISYGLDLTNGRILFSHFFTGPYSIRSDAICGRSNLHDGYGLYLTIGRLPDANSPWYCYN